MRDIVEDAPTNSVGGGGIAGTSVNTQANKNQGEPGVNKNKKRSPVFDEIFSRNPFKNFWTESVNEAKVAPPQPQDQQLLDKDQIGNSAASELFARCRALATIAHFAHLSTDSYSEHQALATFYSDIVDKVDKFAESFIGKYGKFITLPPIPADPQLAIDAISELSDWIGNNRSLITDDSSLQNLIDEIQELINTTLYKLQKLK